jgi:hypothetical protein
MNHINNTRWRRFVWRVANNPVMPDLLAMTEVCNDDVGGGPGNDAREFIRYLEERTGIRYSWRHSGPPGTWCREANAMIVWRSARFTLLKPPAVVSWLSFTRAYDGEREFCSRTSFPYREIAVGLRDNLQKKTVVASSVHVYVDDARQCINENVVLMDRVFERLRATRRLTIVGGDLNQTPAREETTSGDEARAGTQVDPACWYRSLSMLTIEDNANCTTRHEHRLSYYDPQIDHYIDTVHAKHQGAQPGTTKPTICDEWTHSRFGTEDGSGCTDLSGPDQSPDGLMDHGRIDYIWARWETPVGRARSFEPDEASGLVTAAQADKPTGPMYADHRAVKALIKWCLPDEGCRH